MHPSKTHLARGLVKVLEANFWTHFCVIVDEDLISDGFYNEIKQKTTSKMWKMENDIVLSNQDTDEDIIQRLAPVLEYGNRIVILHAKINFALRIFNISLQSNVSKESPPAWFLTEDAYTSDINTLTYFPTGALSFLMNSAEDREETIRDIVTLLSKTFKRVYRERKVDSGFSSCWNLPSVTMRKHFHEIYKMVINASKDGPIEFDVDGSLKSTSFRIRNLVDDGRWKVWRDLGYIRSNNVKPIGIIWPGDSKYMGVKDGKKRYRIVTNPVKPFVMDEVPHDDYAECVSDTTCLKIASTDMEETVETIREYEMGVTNSSRYNISCCRGLSIDLLNRLSSDLDFEFTLYIVFDKTYGRMVNGTWNGMIRDLIHGTAHMAVAAMSITEARSKVIDFTYPYFFSGFSVLYSELKRETPMNAFLEPFDTKVWFAIFVSATLTAIAMALFEWNSPFGLNPWGRKRKSNYSLASGLTMVYSVLFGHTVKTKSPKAWPSKVMQNFWAFAAIFIIASYTANLAAFIAGKHAGIKYTDIHDPRLQTTKLGVLSSSAVDSFLKKVNLKLYNVAQKYIVPNSDEGIKRVINGKINAYLGDYPILDYARAKLDPKCNLKLLSQIFGEDSYGLGLPQDSPLRIPLSEKITHYHQNGYIEELIDVHFADAQCFKKKITQEESHLEVQHHAGLFVLLCIGIFLGICVMMVEHGVYKWVVPYFRERPQTSNWRSTHMMFFSQRLHRIISSAELVSPHASAREMIGIVRNREFARLFQKSTIKKNRMADTARAKRLNRNFFDIVAKAKWMKEMSENNLLDSGGTCSPTIIQIPLKDLCSQTALNKIGSDGIKDDGEGGVIEEGITLDIDNLETPDLMGSDLEEHIPHCTMNFDPMSGETEGLLPSQGPFNLPNGHLRSSGQYLELPSLDSRQGRRKCKMKGVVPAVRKSSLNLPMQTDETDPSLLNNTGAKRSSVQSVSEGLVGDDIEDDLKYNIDDLSKDDLLRLWKVSELKLQRTLLQTAMEKRQLEDIIHRIIGRPEPV